MSDIAARLQGLSPERLRLLARQLKSQSALPAGGTVSGRAAAEATAFAGAELAPEELDRLLAAYGGAEEVEDLYPLSPLQEGMLFHSLHAPEEAAYHDHVTCLLVDRGGLDTDAFKRAFRRVVARHPSLRTGFVWELQGRPHQIVLRHAEVPVAELDWSALPPAEQRRHLEAFLAADRSRPYDLSRPPLMRPSLARLSPDSVRLIFSSHHIIVDAWSEMLILRELSTFYAAFRRGADLQLPPALPYRTYIDWLRRQDPSQAEVMWGRAVEGFATPTPLAPDRPQSGAAGAAGAAGNCRRELSPQTTLDLQACARRHRLTFNTLLQGAWALLLSRLSGERDILFGTVASGRPPDLEGVESIVGLLANTVPVRIETPPEQRVLAWLQSIQERQLELHPYQWTPLPRIQKGSDVPVGEPLFDSVLVFVSTPGGDSRGGPESGLEAHREQYEPRTNLSHNLMVWPGTSLLCRLFYDRSRFDPATIERRMGLFEALLTSLGTAPDARLEELPSLTPAERHQLLVEWNDSLLQDGDGATFLDLFSAQARRAPDRIAVAAGARRGVTYRQLSDDADRIAASLLGQGVGPEDVVAVLAERGSDLLAAMLGIFHAGGVYLPLDPKSPVDRLVQVLEQSRARLVIAERPLVPGMQAAARILDLGELLARPPRSLPPAVRRAPEHLAYVIYTSGSTGMPKGAMVEQRGMLNHLRSKILTLGLAQGDVVAQTASQCFDISVWQLLAALLVGGRVQVVDDEVARDPHRLLEELESCGATIVETVPSMLRALVEEIAQRNEASPQLSSLSWMIPTGEALPPDLCRRWLELRPSVPLLNAYGPTECSDDVTHHRIAEPPPTTEINMPIGRPVVNMQLFILDRALQPVPTGAPGELCVAGIGVGRGYLNDPARTAEVFVPAPFPQRPGDRIYRTGDLARFLPGGEIVFLGRIDHQVKIRGYRVETGEIETLLLQHPSVRSAVVAAHGPRGATSDLRLVAYVIPRDPAEPAPPAELREHLGRKLPDYMVPAAFVVLESLPLNRHGKIDRRALPAPELADPAAPDVQGGAGTPIEELLVGIWCQILGIDVVSVDTPFFKAGGHSLLAIQLVSRIRATFGVELPLRTVFESPTVAQLARAIEAAMKRSDAVAAPPLVRVARHGRLPLSFAQQRLWIVDQLAPGSPAYNFPIGLRLRGRLDIAALDRALTEIVRRHECLSTTFGVADGEPVQILNEPVPFHFPLIDLIPLPVRRREDEARRIADEEARTAFDLARGPLLRGLLLRLDSAYHVMLLTMHHIVSDGWSMGVLIEEVVTLYRAFSEGRPSPLPELAVQYADFAHWQRSWLRGAVLEAHLSYWRHRLRGDLPVLRLPFGRPRPPRPTFRGIRRSFALDAELSEALKRLSRGQGSTLFMTLLAALKALMYRYSGQEDLIVGAEVANRTRIEVEPLIGFFVNMLPLRTDLGGNPTFADLLARVREVSLGAYAHQDLPFDRLVEEVQPERTNGQTTLLQTVFVLENAPTREPDAPALAVEGYGLDNRTAKFELLLMMYETSARSGARIGGTWTLSADLFDDAAASRIATDYESLLRHVVRDPTVRLNRLELQGHDEQGRPPKMQRNESRRKSLLDVQPKAIDVSVENLVNISHLASGGKLPLVVEPAAEGVDLIEWARNNRALIESRLLDCGGILFRGFDVGSASQFEQLCLCFCPELYGEYGDLPRGSVGGRVYESTPYPPDKAILMHNESSQMHCWPLKQWFFCVQPSQQGGETPIAAGRRIYELLDPALRERFAQRGLMYVRNFSRDLDVSWQEFFRTEDRAEVESYCRQASIEVEWRPDGGLRTRRINPAVARHPKTGQIVFFNQIQAHHISCLDPEVRESLLSMFPMEDLPRNVYFGDGSPIADSIVQEIRALYDEIAVAFPWRKGEILMVDNMLVSHSRNPYQGPRKIVVAMGEMIRSEDVVSV